MHTPGFQADYGGAPTGGQETWPQFGKKQQFLRRRFKVTDIASRLSQEYRFLKKLCYRPPATRQWTVRDDFCNMDTGTIEMSPAMQAAFMRVYRSTSKGNIRAALRDMIPVMDYRLMHQQSLSSVIDPEQMIPEGELDTLNAKKDDLYQRWDSESAFSKVRVRDEKGNNALRWFIRLKLLRFQRKAAVLNAAASRTALYSEQEAMAYFLWRGPLIYGAVHRVLYELSKTMPWFVPKTMLDFGAGTGTAILAAKEAYDPGSLSHPVFREKRTSAPTNESAKEWSLRELKYDLKRLERSNSEKKRARFLAVAALVENGELKLEDIPLDLRKELVAAASQAHRNAQERERRERFARLREVVSGDAWRKEDSDVQGEDGSEPLFEGEDGHEQESNKPKAWWERFVDEESERREGVRNARLKPLQQVVAVEPSPGMMSTAIGVLSEEVPNVVWQRFLTPDKETQTHDLVIAAYTLTEIASAKVRRQTVEALWKMTKGVLIIIEHANLPGYNTIMEARDAILEQKDVGLWDWQPTIVGPCPHEKRCPIRFSKMGIKNRHRRVCKTEVTCRSTFIEQWARREKLLKTIEPISYVVFSRNELVPDRVEKRKRALAAEEQQQRAERDRKQRELHEASVKLDDAVFERLSEEALHRPRADNEVPVPPGATAVQVSAAAVPVPSDAAVNDALYKPEWVPTTHQRFNIEVKPAALPVPQHKYNRAPHTIATYSQQRVLQPAEVLTVRSEVEDYRSSFQKKISQYYRIVSSPQCSGRISAHFCTPDGDLIEGRVYRRWVGEPGPRAPTPEEKKGWQYVGGWKLLKSSKVGSLFPSDVPMYLVKKQPQVDFPNTMLNSKDVSHLERVGMEWETPMDPNHIPDEDEMSIEDAREYRKQQRDAEEAEVLESQLQSLGMARSLDAKQVVDARAEITGEQWARAVRSAKLKAKGDVKKAPQHIPFANKLRHLEKYRTIKPRKDRSRFRQANRKEREQLGMANSPI